MDKPNSTKAEVRIKARIKVQKRTNIEVELPLSLVVTFGVFTTSLSLPIGGRF